MTAFPWDEQREPWRTIGLAFAAECSSIATGPPPPPQQLPSAYRRPVARPMLPKNAELRRLRKSKGLSQRAVGKLVGCSQPTISAAEDGRSTRELVSRIRAALEGMG